MNPLIHQCTCGELQQCDNACYCDGSQTDASTMDEARVVDKSKLPLVSVDFAQGQADKGRVDVEPLMCGSKPICKSCVSLLASLSVSLVCLSWMMCVSKPICKSCVSLLVDVRQQAYQ